MQHSNVLCISFFSISFPASAQQGFLGAVQPAVGAQPAVQSCPRYPQRERKTTVPNLHEESLEMCSQTFKFFDKHQGSSFRLTRCWPYVAFPQSTQLKEVLHRKEVKCWDPPRPVQQSMQVSSGQSLEALIMSCLLLWSNEQR